MMDAQKVNYFKCRIKECVLITDVSRNVSSSGLGKDVILSLTIVCLAFKKQICRKLCYCVTV